jgi:hypothetical protein
MTNMPSENEARTALENIEFRRQQIVAMINIPWWYWGSVGLGWIALGAVTDLHNPWATTGGTLLFGAAHASIAWRVLDGRHGSSQLSVRANLVSGHVPFYVLGGLIALAAVTALVATLLTTHHVGHPVTIASVFVAVIVIVGGPLYMASVRRRAAQMIIS